MTGCWRVCVSDGSWRDLIFPVVNLHRERAIAGYCEAPLRAVTTAELETFGVVA